MDAWETPFSSIIGIAGPEDDKDHFLGLKRWDLRLKTGDFSG
jgi:hypothetical protein